MEGVAPAMEAAPKADKPAGGPHWGTGRRKSAVARVRILPGSGKVLVNRREVDVYFTEPKDRSSVYAPLEVTGKSGQWDVHANVRGGGFTGQSGAILLGLSRALVAADESLEETLRDAGFLTRDARKVERKKPGRRKARRSFQFSKR
jgi:small subunit ribosomal protein S9